MRKYSLREHFLELKKRILKIGLFFIFVFFFVFLFKEEVFKVFFRPLIDLSSGGNRRVIYTGVAEAFFAYIKLSLFVSFALTLPFLCYQSYGFVSPGLNVFEKKIAKIVFSSSPILFFLGGAFVFVVVMPQALKFFLSYENDNMGIPLVMEVRIIEYCGVVIQLMMAFGLSFQAPVILVNLCVMGCITSMHLVRWRRLGIVVVFILAAILTPPDVLSQIALAIPLIMLYELSILLCRFVEKRRKDVRHKMD